VCHAHRSEFSIHNLSLSSPHCHRNHGNGVRCTPYNTNRAVASDFRSQITRPPAAPVERFVRSREYQCPATIQRNKTPKTTETICHLTVDFPIQAMVVRQNPPATAKVAMPKTTWRAVQDVPSPGCRLPVPQAKYHLSRNAATPTHKSVAGTLRRIVALLDLKDRCCNCMLIVFAPQLMSVFTMRSRPTMYIWFPYNTLISWVRPYKPGRVCTAHRSAGKLLDGFVLSLGAVTQSEETFLIHFFSRQTVLAGQLVDDGFLPDAVCNPHRPTFRSHG